MRRHLWRMVRTFRVSAAARWRTVRQVRSQTRTVLSERRSRRCLERPGAEAALDRAECAGGADDWLEAEVLRVIARHPEGVRALDIGNELGVDWRRVPAVADRLVEHAMVEQIAHEFYPVEKAS
jgi:hypothetical protein